MFDVLFGTMIVFGVSVALMSVGVAFKGRELKGSCGGPNASCPCSDADKQACASRGEH
jgi:hypothetical protein